MFARIKDAHLDAKVVGLLKKTTREREAVKDVNIATTTSDVMKTFHRIMNQTGCSYHLKNRAK